MCFIDDSPRDLKITFFFKSFFPILSKFVILCLKSKTEGFLFFYLLVLNRGLWWPRAMFIDTKVFWTFKCAVKTYIIGRKNLQNTFRFDKSSDVFIVKLRFSIRNSKYRTFNYFFFKYYRISEFIPSNHFSAKLNFFVLTHQK